MSTHDQQAGVKFGPIPVESGMGMSGISQAMVCSMVLFLPKP